MINLQQEPIFDPLVRIQVMEQGHWTDSTQPWVDMPMAARLDSLGVRYWGNINGVELDSVERTCLPDVGSAVFHMEFGYINGGQYDTGNVGEADTAWGLIKNGAGMDVRIKCLKCGRKVLLPRAEFERQVRQFVKSQTSLP